MVQFLAATPQKPLLENMHELMQLAAQYAVQTTAPTEYAQMIETFPELFKAHLTMSVKLKGPKSALH